MYPCYIKISCYLDDMISKQYFFHLAHPTGQFTGPSVSLYRDFSNTYGFFSGMTVSSILVSFSKHPPACCQADITYGVTARGPHSLFDNSDDKAWDRG